MTGFFMPGRQASGMDNLVHGKSATELKEGINIYPEDRKLI